MLLDRRHQLLHRIIADYNTIFINNKKYIIQRPSSTLLCDAQLEYDRILSECKFGEYMREHDCLNYLVGIGKWTIDGDKKIQEIHKAIEDQQVDLYNTTLKLENDKFIRQQLVRLRQLLQHLYKIKTSLFSFTDRYLAQQVQHNYILKHTVYENGQLLDYISPRLLELIKIKLLNLSISISEFRELARTDPWRSYCGFQDNPFNKSIIELDQDKRMLLMYSNMYDNIQEYPDKPAQNIIEDDDALDGWMIVQKRQKQNEIKQKQTDNIVSKLSPKYSNATEIFIPVKNREQYDRVQSMNSPTSKIVQKQRQELIAKQGQVGVGKLPDEILTVQQQTINQMKQHK